MSWIEWTPQDALLNVLFQNWKEKNPPNYKLFTTKVSLPAWGTLWTAVAMVTWRTVFDHILKKQVFTYRAQQDPNLRAIALGLYNKDRHAFSFFFSKKVMQRGAVVPKSSRLEEREKFLHLNYCALPVITISLQWPHTNNSNSMV